MTDETKNYTIIDDEGYAFDYEDGGYDYDGDRFDRLVREYHAAELMKATKIEVNCNCGLVVASHDGQHTTMSIDEYPEAFDTMDEIDQANTILKGGI